MSESVLEPIRRRALGAPDAPALLHGETSVSHGQLLALTQRAASAFHLQGIRPGYSVALAMDHTPLHCVALLGLLRLGALVVPMSPALPAAERERLARKYGVQAVVADQAGARIAGLPFLPFTALSAGGAGAATEPVFQPEAATPARLALTSGSSGEPKAVLHTQGELLLRALHSTEGWDERTRLLPPRLHLTVAAASLLGTLCRGGAVVFPWGGEFDDLIAAARRHAATHLVLSPAAALAVAGRLPAGGLPGLRQLRLVGGRPTAAQLDLLRTQCTPQVHVTYALTELGPLAVATPESWAQDATAAGAINPWVQLEVVDPRGRRLPRGRSGEVRARSEPMPQGYYRDEEQTRGHFRDGWFHTGDLGRLSADGVLRIEGRRDELLNIGGHKVQPAALEARLLQHPLLREAAVFALPAQDGGSRLAAALVLAPGGDPAQVAGHCRELGFTAPGCVLLLERLPRNELGKVLRGELRLLAAAQGP